MNDRETLSERALLDQLRGISQRHVLRVAADVARSGNALRKPFLERGLVRHILCLLANNPVMSKIERVYHLSDQRADC